MKRFAGRATLLAAAFAALSLCAPPRSAAQEPSAEDPAKTTRVALGGAAAVPGAPAVVPVYLTPAEGARIGRLKLEIQFVSRSLKLSRVEPGIVVELSGAQLQTQVAEGKNPEGLETTTVILEASAPPGEAGTEGIRGGLLAYLNLHLSEEARPAMVTLKVSGEALETGSNRPVANLRTQDAQVEVLAPGTEPIVACFFFTH